MNQARPQPQNKLVEQELIRRTLEDLTPNRTQTLMSQAVELVLNQFAGQKLDPRALMDIRAAIAVKLKIPVHEVQIRTSEHDGSTIEVVLPMSDFAGR